MPLAQVEPKEQGLVSKRAIAHKARVPAVKLTGRDPKESAVNKIERKQFVAELQKIAEICRADPEIAHTEADKLLCAALDKLGYHDIVEAWRRVPKWYA